MLGLLFAVSAAEGALRLGGLILGHVQEKRNRISLAQHPDGYRIMCIGESTTAGGKAAWPARLERILNERYPGTGFSVVNKGRPGADISALIGELEKNLDEVRPDLVITMMGVNDGFIRYYDGINGAGSFLFRHSRFYRWLKLAFKKEKVTQLRTAPGIPPLIRRADQEDPYTPYKDAYLYPARQEGNLREKLAKNPDDAKTLYILGRNLTAAAPHPGGKPPRGTEGEKLLLRAAALAPDKAYIFHSLGIYYRNSGDLGSAVKMLKRAAEIYPAVENWRQLGIAYKFSGMNGPARDALEKAVDFDNLYEEAFFELYRLHMGDKEFPEAGKLLETAAAHNPDNEKIAAALVSFYSETGRPALAREQQKKLAKKRAMLTARTKGYYDKLIKILAARGIRLACMQYPMCPAGPLRTLLGSPENIIFVDNDGIFRKAVANKGPDFYFRDMFGGEFGHCTGDGNELIADNVAGTLAPYFQTTGVLPAAKKDSGAGSGS